MAGISKGVMTVAVGGVLIVGGLSLATGLFAATFDGHDDIREILEFDTKESKQVVEISKGSCALKITQSTMTNRYGLIVKTVHVEDVGTLDPDDLKGKSTMFATYNIYIAAKRGSEIKVSDKTGNDPLKTKTWRTAKISLHERKDEAELFTLLRNFIASCA